MSSSDTRGPGFEPWPLCFKKYHFFTPKSQGDPLGAGCSFGSLNQAMRPGKSKKKKTIQKVIFTHREMPLLGRVYPSLKFKSHLLSGQKQGKNAKQRGPTRRCHQSQNESCNVAHPVPVHSIPAGLHTQRLPFSKSIYCFFVLFCIQIKGSSSFQCVVLTSLTRWIFQVNLLRATYIFY